MRRPAILSVAQRLFRLVRPDEFGIFVHPPFESERPAILPPWWFYPFLARPKSRKYAGLAQPPPPLFASSPTHSHQITRSAFDVTGQDRKATVDLTR
ncbi:hypothetical protein D3C87_1603510 [compost metagenome]